MAFVLVIFVDVLFYNVFCIFYTTSLILVALNYTKVHLEILHYFYNKLYRDKKNIHTVWQQKSTTKNTTLKSAANGLIRNEKGIDMKNRYIVE